MAKCTKANIIKAAIFTGVIFAYYNFISNRTNRHEKEKFWFSHIGTQQWSKLEERARFYTNATTHENVYTLIFNSDNSTLEKVQLNIFPTENNNSIYYSSNRDNLYVNSTDFERKFFNKKDFLSNNYNGSNNNNNSNNTVNNGDTQTNGVYKLLQSVMNSIIKPLCPEIPPDLDNPIVKVDTNLESLEAIEPKFIGKLQPGGWHSPEDCNARDHVAIIVPFRDRYAHLPVFLKNLHPFLMKQKIEYGIFIIEQTNGKSFNRAALMNVGYLEALKLKNWDCFIFHDVDLLPLDNRNLYSCPDQPRHMSVAVDIFGYKLPYATIFGGVSAMTTEQFKKVNGFSNSFWGWGGEDDDMSNRLKHSDFHISRYPINIARYMMLNHAKEKANPKRFENLLNGARKFDSDGLSSLKYEIYSAKKFPLFTWYLVELKINDNEHSSNPS